jgi:hypothetical protein
MGSVTIGRDNGCVFMGFNFGDGIDKPKFVFGGRTDTNYYNNTKKRNLTDVEIVIHGDKAQIISLEDPIGGVVIENKQIVNTLRQLWNLAWKAAEEYNKKK